MPNFIRSILIFCLANFGSACGFNPEYRTITYEYYVPPMEQIKGEHRTIAIKILGEKLKHPDVFPESERMRLKWIKDYDKADVQVLITVKTSYLKHDHNYYHRSTEFKDVRPMRAIHQARIKAHVQTDYEVEIRDRKKDEQLLFYQGGRQYYFESLEDTEDLKGSERTIIKDFNKNEPEARQAVIDYLWDNMRGERYCLLKKHKAKIMAEDFSILKYHPEIEAFKQAYEKLKVPDKKQAAPEIKQLYTSTLDQLLAIKEEDRGSEEKILIEGAKQGLTAAEYINTNQYDPRLPRVNPTIKKVRTK